MNQKQISMQEIFLELEKSYCYRSDCYHHFDYLQYNISDHRTTSNKTVMELIVRNNPEDSHLAAL